MSKSILASLKGVKDKKRTKIKKRLSARFYSHNSLVATRFGAAIPSKGKYPLL